MALAPILILGGKRIANLDELRATDDFEKLQIAAEHGRLLNWLRFHHYNDIATDVESLSENKDNPSFFEDVCYVLGIQCPKEYSAVGKKMPSAIEYETELQPLMRKILVNMIATYAYRLQNYNTQLSSTDNAEEESAFISSTDNDEVATGGLFLQPIDVLELSERTCTFLSSVGIKSVGDLCQKNYKMAQKDFSIKVLQEIEEKLTSYGLSLGMCNQDIIHTYFILMPEMGISEESALLSSWRVKEGDEVKIDQTIFEIETGKACFEVPARHSGIVRKKLTPSGKEVKVGTPVAIMEIL